MNKGSLCPAFCVGSLENIINNLSGTGHGDWPPSSISPDQFAVFLKSKVEAIHRDLAPYLETVDRAETSSALSCPMRLNHFDTVMSEMVDRVVDRCHATTSSLDPCPAWLIKAARLITSE